MSLFEQSRTVGYLSSTKSTWGFYTSLKVGKKLAGLRYLVLRLEYFTGTKVVIVSLRQTSFLILILRHFLIYFLFLLLPFIFHSVGSSKPS